MGVAHSSCYRLLITQTSLIDIQVSLLNLRLWLFVDWKLMHLVCKIHQEIESGQVQEQNVLIASYCVLMHALLATQLVIPSVSNPFLLLQNYIVVCFQSKAYKFQRFLWNVERSFIKYNICFHSGHLSEVVHLYCIQWRFIVGYIYDLTLLTWLKLVLHLVSVSCVVILGLKQNKRKMH